MGGSTHITSAAVRRALPKVMAYLTSQFLAVVHASLDGKGTVAWASRHMGFNETTLRRRIAKNDVPLAVIFATPGLGERFWSALCADSHRVASLAYVARKRSSRSRSRRAKRRTRKGVQ